MFKSYRKHLSSKIPIEDGKIILSFKIVLWFTLNIPNTASLQLAFSSFRYLSGFRSQIKSTAHIFPLWLRWLTHCTMLKSKYKWLAHYRKEIKHKTVLNIWPCLHLHQCNDVQYHKKIQSPETSGTCRHVHVCFHSSHWNKKQ